MLKEYVCSLSGPTLKQLVTENDGRISVKLDGHEVTLVRGTHFFINKKDKKGI